MNSNEVILVNEKDEVTGSMEKMETHRKGLLHRAFSVFIFNSAGEMLLQQRAMGKYHSAGLWTNTCCSHPAPGEQTKTAAERRLYEELGFVVPLEFVFHFTYKAAFQNGLTEHEFDHVYIGTYDGQISPDENEVMDVEYKSLHEIERSVSVNPENYTPWFLIAFPKVSSRIQQLILKN